MMTDDKGQRGELGRRDLMKLGAGVLAATALGVQQASAQRESARADTIAPPGSPPPSGWRPHTGAGYQNTFNRLGANGPMDDTSRKIVEYVSRFKDSDITPSALKALNRTIVDSLAAIIAGFEEDAVRIAARAARLSPAGREKCTIFGYGISTTPELAAFANSCMVRLVDFNDTPHNSNLIPAALAMGEALHASGRQVLAAIAVGYEVTTVPGVGEAVPAAMAVGKVMGLDEDRLANALTIALTPHVALNKGVGAMSMWKGVRSAEAVKCGTWAAILAREGMTGPPQPFEGRGGLWYSQGRIGRSFTLPEQSKLAVERGVNKRYPSDQMTQQTLGLIPEMRAWTKPDEIEWIQYDMTFGDWEECGDAPKWDPRNRDTADHSIPYTLARNLIDGESYLDAFTDEKLPYRDPVVRELMSKITLSPVAEWRGNGVARITIHKKSGEERYWDTHNGNRNATDMSAFPQMSDEDITKKFTRACAFRHVSDAQRDRALQQWWDLGALQDIGDAIRGLATFGQPRQL
jgi:2-methylcitrate dehydratase